MQIATNSWINFNIFKLSDLHFTMKKKIFVWNWHRIRNSGLLHTFITLLTSTTTVPSKQPARYFQKVYFNINAKSSTRVKMLNRLKYQKKLSCKTVKIEKFISMFKPHIVGFCWIDSSFYQHFLSLYLLYLYLIHFLSILSMYLFIYSGLLIFLYLSTTHLFKYFNQTEIVNALLNAHIVESM